MKIVLQRKDTGDYFKDVGEWTRSAAEAMDFLSSTKAIEFCMMNNISDVQLVLRFEEQHYDIVMPMADRGFSTARMVRA